MRYSCILLILFFLVACKKRGPEPTAPSPVEEQKMPDGIEGLNVKGVGKSGILFTDLNGTISQPNRIQVTLPADYKYGEMITLHFTMKKGYGLGVYYGNGLELLDPDSVAFNYEGRYFMIHILTPENEIRGQIYLYVNPTKPLEAPSLGRHHNLIIHPGSLLAQVPVKNWGTNYYLDDSLTREVYGGVARLKNTRTGKVVSAMAVFEEIDSGYITVLIPDTIDAGEYELTLVRDHRSVVVPDRVVINYGSPAMNLAEFVNQSAFKDKGYAVSFQGYNLTPEHRYEMVLANDVTGARKIPLIPNSHIELGTNLPSDMPQGTYQVTLYINGAPVEYRNEVTGVNLLFVRENTDQPAIWLLSQRSQFFSGPAGWVYRPTTRFNRNEEIILYGESRPHILAKEGQVPKLLLQSVDGGGGTYELPLSDSTAPALLSFFPQFRITDSVPSGRYEARLGIQEKTEAKPRISGTYYRIINIEK